MTSQARALLDASAVLAWLFEEPGAETVARLAGHSVITAANMAEVLYRAAAEGYRGSLASLAANLEQSGFPCVDNSVSDSVRAAEFIRHGRSRGLSLSLGDGMCLAAGERLDLPVVTGDLDWLDLDLPVRVMGFR